MGGDEGWGAAVLLCAEPAGGDDLSPSSSLKTCPCIAAQSRGFSARLGSAHLCSTPSARCTSAGFAACSDRLGRREEGRTAASD